MRRRRQELGHAAGEWQQAPAAQLTATPPPACHPDTPAQRQGKFWLLAGFANPDSELFGDELQAAGAAAAKGLQFCFCSREGVPAAAAAARQQHGSKPARRSHAAHPPSPLAPARPAFWPAAEANPERMQLDIALSLTRKNARGEPQYVQVRACGRYQGGRLLGLRAAAVAATQ